MNYRFLIVLLVSAWLLAASNQSQADIYFHDEEIDEGRQWTYRLTVTPAAASTPLLKYRLLQPEVEKKSGNSVPFILKALNISKQAWREHQNLLSRRPDGLDATDLYATEIATRDLDLKALQEIVQALPYPSILDELERASLRAECDWDFGLRNLTGPEIVNFTLEDHQESRQLTRLVGLLVCHQIATRDYEQALDTMKLHTEFALRMGVPELLVCRLISMAELSIMNDQVLRLMASPLSPNLYWSLTELPQPVVPMRDAIRFDLTFSLRHFPILRDPEKKNYDADRWQLELKAFLSDLEQFQKSFGNRDDSQLGIALEKLRSSDQTADIFPVAKARLESLEKPWDLNAMPPEQVILIDAAYEHQRLLDDVAAWSHLPFPELVQHKHWQDQENELKQSDQGSYGALLAQLALPALKAVRNAEARLDRDIAAMRVIEALRMHASKAGQFPKTLLEVTCVPVPENPSTGEAFAYRLEGKDAILELPFSDGHSIAKTFDLQLMGGGK